MAAKKNQTTKILADGYEITVRSEPGQPDFISLTDIAKRREKDDPNGVVQNWMRRNSTIEFLGEWERRHNPGFNMMEFMKFQLLSGKNSFIMSPKSGLREPTPSGSNPRPDGMAAPSPTTSSLLNFFRGCPPLTSSISWRNMSG